MCNLKQNYLFSHIFYIAYFSLCFVFCAQQFNQILKYIDIGKNEGAKCLFGGKREGTRGMLPPMSCVMELRWWCAVKSFQLFRIGLTLCWQNVGRKFLGQFWQFFCSIFTRFCVGGLVPPHPGVRCGSGFSPTKGRTGNFPALSADFGWILGGLSGGKVPPPRVTK